MMLVGTAFGAAFAFVLFCLTAVSLPLLLDKELDFVTAMLTSIAVVKRNPARDAGLGRHHRGADLPRHACRVCWGCSLSCRCWDMRHGTSTAVP